MRKYILTILLMAMIGVLSAQNIDSYFKVISNEKGLSQATVITKTQDAQGFMWYGTRNAQNKYDRYEFPVYHSIPGDTTALSNNHISKLLWEQMERHWSFSIQNLGKIQKSLFLAPSDHATIRIVCNENNTL